MESLVNQFLRLYPTQLNSMNSSLSMFLAVALRRGMAEESVGWGMASWQATLLCSKTWTKSLHFGLEPRPVEQVPHSLQGVLCPQVSSNRRRVNQLQHSFCFGLTRRSFFSPRS